MARFWFLNLDQFFFFSSFFFSRQDGAWSQGHLHSNIPCGGSDDGVWEPPRSSGLAAERFVQYFERDGTTLVFVSESSPDWLTNLLTQAEQNLGMAMVFTLASRAGEWLEETFLETVRFTESEDERIRREAEEVQALLLFVDPQTVLILWIISCC